MLVYKHKISNKITIFSTVFRKIHFSVTKTFKDISCYQSYFSRYIMLVSITCDWQLCTTIKSVSVAIFFLLLFDSFLGEKNILLWLPIKTWFSPSILSLYCILVNWALPVNFFLAVNWQHKVIKNLETILSINYSLPSISQCCANVTDISFGDWYFMSTESALHLVIGSLLLRI